MNILVWALWAMAAIPIIGLVLWFVGSVFFAVDEVKAVRYLAEKYDEKHKR
jgi:hypothetical protein